MLVEVVLDLLVGDVDADLLERVDREVLEAEDVEQTDHQTVLSVSTGEIGKALLLASCLAAEDIRFIN